MASFYALKIVKDLGLPLRHRIRLIFGTDEEKTHRCMEKYKELEPMPAFGFTPDADFPIVSAEKGQINTRILFPQDPETPDAKGEYELLSFRSGVVANMVPEAAEAVVAGEEGALQALGQAYRAYCNDNGYKGGVETGEQAIKLHMAGKAAHGMEPELGMNAGLALIHFLKNYSWGESAGHYLHTVDTLLFDDVHGRALGIAMEDELSGKLTVNSGILQFDPRGETFFHINLRFPVCGSYEEILKRISVKLEEHRLAMEPPSLKKPHHVPGDHPMIQAMQAVYEAETQPAGEPAVDGRRHLCGPFPDGRRVRSAVSGDGIHGPSAERIHGDRAAAAMHGDIRAHLERTWKLGDLNRLLSTNLFAKGCMDNGDQYGDTCPSGSHDRTSIQRWRIRPFASAFGQNEGARRADLVLRAPCRRAGYLSHWPRSPGAFQHGNIARGCG